MNLDNHKLIQKLDQNNVAASIGNLPEQLAAAWMTAKKVRLPPSFHQAENIIFCGMGGSNLASELVKRAFSGQINKPLVLVRGYNLPVFAGPNSLVIISSYSGNTEETISCLNQALQFKTKIICISSGGKIETLAQKNKLAYFKIDTSLNPSGQPRYGLGSQLGVTLMIFNKLKLININEDDLAEVLGRLKELSQTLLPEVKTKNNFAKQLALALYNKNLYIIGAEFLSANAHILANQINESAKQLASPYKIPELNHHFLEALSYPDRLMQKAAFVFLISSGYSPRVAKRFLVTKKIIDHKKMDNFAIKSTRGSAWRQSLEVLLVGSWVSFYLAMANQVNPAQIPWVDYFKAELEK